jgi:NAD(P)-dependent dehydrogenase (short-subunit alcohol dehydrogenase family)
MMLPAWAVVDNHAHDLVVIGGSGLIGSRLCKNLAERDHQAVAASPRSGVNAMTGEGLAEAIAAAGGCCRCVERAILDDAAVMMFFETSTRNLLAAEAKAISARSWLRRT